MLTVNPSEIPIPKLHQYLLGAIGPRPICFASTIDKAGRPNLAPFSFFNVFSANPPIVVFAPNNSGRDGTPKHTWLNVLEVPEVVVNIVDYAMVQQMNVAAAPWERGVSEFETAGFTALPSDLIQPLRVAESPVQLECKVIGTQVLGEGGGAGNLVIAQVVRIHIQDKVLNDEGKIDPRKMDLVARMGGAWYCHATPESMFELAQPMTRTIGYDALPDAVKHNTHLSANEIGKMATLAEWPHEELIAGSKVMHAGGNRDTEASALITAGKVAEALCLYL
jgi:flavin reductase (DIM6/NTAB) family NADH-FMN oxidoreductase RutF